ncbi:cytidylate kinase [Ameyamaea chiangmaiensis NBRC 103196]|uniref:Cytidylate kinase n=1 Tax=Ameyamaea chiangmaiensis TaxID=442969 RepID=A0A850P9A2_9PROT|nr:(d)CMP kinase [Ameyamaea chiangmaiensis]MBS4075911.1 (d)CMP kinase [Ameyamaea chiangmaiensis]NVN40594.1 (d)CMP kinase [Ameyamaea chiangmaiensis]GBQ61758.1 cytidylate kinase [Ameyamaea chiangmaiensis NBRC 103196]
MTAAPVIIAVDGPAAAGKGTLARRLAQALSLPYLDTGLLYRAVARRVLDAGRDPSAPGAEAEAHALAPSDLDRTDLRTPEVDRAASLVAAQPAVRAALIEVQRRFGRESGAVLDGRDIGTVIFPDATVKLYITASPLTRARRRWAQGLDVAPVDGDQTAHIEAVAAQLAARDAADSARAVAPLRPAADAVVIETDAMDAETVLAKALQVVRTRLA